MANYNRVILIGNITRTPETRHTQSGTSVTKFGLATNRKFKDAEEVCFVDLVAFGKVGEIIQKYCDKGDPIMVDGRLQYSAWDDKESGAKRSKLEVVVENMQLMSGRKEDGGGQRRGGGREQQDAGGPDYGEVPV